MSSESIRMTLPNGDVLDIEPGATAGDIAASIGPGLAKAAIAAVVNGETVSLMEPISSDAEIRILTDKDADSLAVLRHSAAHVLATAVRELRPGAGIGFGPAIDDGFYYDFDVDAPFTPDDLEAFEAKMAEVVGADQPFERRRVTKEEARELFSDDPLKLERLEEFDDDEVITVYENGPFLDLCKGPHVPSTGRLRHFKLLSGAGAYWMGDEKRQMLQRIYGTAFHKKSHLEEHLHRLEEAKKRDHRTLGRELDLFSIQEEVGSGFVLWHPRGGIVRHTVEEFLKGTLLQHGYELVYTPQVASEELYRISGHLEVFEADMFPAMDDEGTRFRLRPMNCPHHFIIYKTRQRSYRDLPLRFAELGTCYRYERSGTLHGMLRVRCFTQDDAHIFVRPDQIADEYDRLLDLADELLTVFGYEYILSLATRPREVDRRPDGLRRSDGDADRRPRATWRDVRGRGGRGRLLWPEDRRQRRRRHRPAVAGRNVPARLPDARTLRPRVHRVGQPRPQGGRHPPDAARLDGALRGRAHRNTMGERSRRGSRRSRCVCSLFRSSGTKAPTS